VYRTSRPALHRVRPKISRRLPPRRRGWRRCRQRALRGSQVRLPARPSAGALECCCQTLTLAPLQAKIGAERMPCQLTCLLDDRGDLLRRCPRKWQSPSPPAFETAAASSGVTAPPMGASTIGTSIPTRSHSGVRTQRVYGTAASVIKQRCAREPGCLGEGDAHEASGARVVVLVGLSHTSDRGRSASRRS